MMFKMCVFYSHFSSCRLNLSKHHYIKRSFAVCTLKKKQHFRNTYFHPAISCQKRRKKMADIPPTVLPLDDAKEKMIDELLQRIHQKYPTAPQLAKLIQRTENIDAPTPLNLVRLYAYSYLLSRGWNMNASMAMVDEVIHYREQAHADDRAIFPVPFSVRGWSLEEVQKLTNLRKRETGALDRLARDVDSVVQAGVHYWDRHGNPVFYVLAGRIDEGGLMKILKRNGGVGAPPAETFWKFIEHYMLMFECLCQFQNDQKESGAPLEGVSRTVGVVRDISIVMDCKGLHIKMLWKPFMDLLKECMKKLFSSYPNSVYQIYLVNAPSVTRIAYAIVRPLLDENIQSKVHIVSPDDTLKALERLIHPMFIPSFLGGHCTCPNNCIATFDPVSCDHGKGRSEQKEEAIEEGLTEFIKVARGAKFQKEIPVEEGEIIAWNFAGSEIEFYAFFVPAPIESVQKMKRLDKEKDKNFMISHCKTRSQGSSFTAAESGTVVLVFDNSKAWINAASLDLQVERSTSVASYASGDMEFTSQSSASVKEEKPHEGTGESAEE